MPSGNVHDTINMLVFGAISIYGYTKGADLTTISEIFIMGALFTLVISPDRIEPKLKMRHRGISHSVIVWGCLYAAALWFRPEYSTYINAAALAISLHLILDLLKDDVNKIRGINPIGGK